MGRTMSPERFSSSSVSLRAGLVLVFLLIGFVFPLAWVLAIFWAISVYDDLFGKKVDERRRHDFLYEEKASKQDWQARLKRACDSPAETSFLDAMVAAFDLKPVQGRLTGGGITLDLQVGVEFYRLDFLVNERLVVEIDGAKYHSSPEAMERDQRRDAFLRDRGYEVLRIPAKYPLYIPGEAIDRVRAVLPVIDRQDREREAEFAQALKPRAIFGALRDGARTIGNDLSDGMRQYNENTENRRAQIAANAQARVDAVEREIQAELDADPALRKIYESLEKEFR